MKYSVLEKIMRDETFTVVVRYYVEDTNNEVLFERVENLDFNIKGLAMEQVTNTIIERGKQIKMLYEMQQQLEILQGEILEQENELPIEGEI